MNAQVFIDTARTMVSCDKGLLAMDESNPTCNKRFARRGIPQTEVTRRRSERQTIARMVRAGISEPQTKGKSA